MNRLKSAELQSMRCLAEYNLVDHRRNLNILEELKLDPVVKKLTQYKRQWLIHVSRMDTQKNTCTIDL
jgi:hypothetical protein